MPLEHYSTVVSTSKNDNIKSVYSVLKEHVTDFFDEITMDDESVVITANYKDHKVMTIKSVDFGVLSLFDKNEKNCFNVTALSSASTTISVLISDVYKDDNKLIFVLSAPNLSTYSRAYMMVLSKTADGSIIAVCNGTNNCLTTWVSSIAVSNINSFSVSTKIFNITDDLIGASLLYTTDSGHLKDTGRVNMLGTRFSFAPVLTVSGEVVDNVFHVVCTNHEPIDDVYQITDGQHKYLILNTLAYRYE